MVPGTCGSFWFLLCWDSKWAEPTLRHQNCHVHSQATSDWSPRTQGGPRHYRQHKNRPAVVTHLHSSSHAHLTWLTCVGHHTVVRQWSTFECLVAGENVLKVPGGECKICLHYNVSLSNTHSCLVSVLVLFSTWFWFRRTMSSDDKHQMHQIKHQILFPDWNRRSQIHLRQINLDVFSQICLSFFFSLFLSQPSVPESFLLLALPSFLAWMQPSAVHLSVTRVGACTQSRYASICTLPSRYHKELLPCSQTSNLNTKYTQQDLILYLTLCLPRH